MLVPFFAMASPEELLGIIQGLTGTIKEQHKVSSATQRQIQELSSSVAELSTSLRSQEPSALRLPPLYLPEFSGGENVDRFSEQFTQVLQSSSVDPKYWIPYLKQQCQKDSRAFDIICSFELANASKANTKTSPEEFRALYDACLKSLCLQRGIPKDQQTRNLLATYYALKQNANESVSNFAHRFLEIQHALEKLIPGIHTSPDGNQMELIHAFSMKLLPHLSKPLISRDTPFADILDAIECAKRQESVNIIPDSASMSTALYSGHQQPKGTFTKQTSPGLPKSEICRNFNRFSPSRCELPHNICRNGYQHRCSICNVISCKALNHRPVSTPGFRRNNARRPNSPPPRSNSYVARNKHSPIASAHVAEPLEPVSVESVKKVLSDFKQELHSSILSEVEKRLPLPVPPPPPLTLPPPVPAPSASLQDRIFGIPATRSMSSVSPVSAPDLANRNILWTKITSAGVSLPIPLDSCCSVSLVSQNHADLVSRSRPDLLFTKLEQPIPVSVAGPSSTLRAVGTMQIPIIWENGRLTTFTMLVVPELSWPILFGQNHLRITDAHIFSKDLRVYFAEPSMNFYVTCYNSSPLAAFPSLKSRTSFPSSAANVTCLLTPLLIPDGNSPIRLFRGLNLITVCLLLSSSFLNSPLFSGPLWLEGHRLSPGLETLSGPIELSAIRSQFPSGNLENLQALLSDNFPNYSSVALVALFCLQRTKAPPWFFLLDHLIQK